MAEKVIRQTQEVIKGNRRLPGKISRERPRYQKQSWFKRRQRFRAEIEARISPSAEG